MEVLVINQLLNEGISSKQVRLVSEAGSEVVSTKEALNLAYSQELDLVVISANTEPPVCKIMDYSKFLYEQSKKEKENKKKQKIVQIKEIRMTPFTDEHDILIKANNAKRFLADEDKVKVSIRFKGRQNNNPELGNKIMDKFLLAVGENVVVEKPAKLEGSTLSMVLSPKKI